MQADEDPLEIRSKRKSATQKQNIRSGRSHNLRLWSRDIPNYDEFTPTKYACKICKELIKKELLAHPKTWWERQMILMAMVFSGCKTKEDAKKEYQTFVKNYKKGFIMEVQGGFFFVCSDHLAYVGKIWLDTLCIESPDDVLDADGTAVREAMSLMKFFNDREVKFKTEKAFLEHCDQFISYVWHEIRELSPILEDLKVVFKKEPSQTHQDGPTDGAQNELDIDGHAVIPHERYSSSEEDSDSSPTSSEMNNVKAAFEKMDGKEIKKEYEEENERDLPETVNQSGKRKIKEEVHDESLDEEINPTVSLSSELLEAPNEDLILKQGDCDICGEHAVAVVELTTLWNRRFMLYMAFKLKIMKRDRCQRLFHQKERLLSCFEHAEKSVEEIFRMFGTREHSTFLSMYEGSQFLSSINRFFEDICRVFDLWYETRPGWIGEVRAFVVTIEKVNGNTQHSVPSSSAETVSSEPTTSNLKAATSRRSVRFQTSPIKDCSKRSYSTRSKSIRHVSTRSSACLPPSIQPSPSLPSPESRKFEESETCPSKLVNEPSTSRATENRRTSILTPNTSLAKLENKSIVPKRQPTYLRLPPSDWSADATDSDEENIKKVKIEEASTSSTAHAISNRWRCHVCDKKTDAVVSLSIISEIFCVFALLLAGDREWTEAKLSSLYHDRLKKTLKMKLLVCRDHYHEYGDELLKYLGIRDYNQIENANQSQVKKMRELAERIDSTISLPDDLLEKCIIFGKKCKK